MLLDEPVSSLRELETLAAGTPPDGAPGEAPADSGVFGQCSTSSPRPSAASSATTPATRASGTRSAQAGRHLPPRRPPTPYGRSGTGPRHPGHGAEGSSATAPSTGCPRSCTAITRDHRRSGDADAGWIDWLEQLPWTRRSGAPINLVRVLAALDAGPPASTASMRASPSTSPCAARNPHSSAVLCLAAPAASPNRPPTHPAPSPRRWLPCPGRPRARPCRPGASDRPSSSRPSRPGPAAISTPCSTSSCSSGTGRNEPKPPASVSPPPTLPPTAEGMPRRIRPCPAAQCSASQRSLPASSHRGRPSSPAPAPRRRAAPTPT